MKLKSISGLLVAFALLAVAAIGTSSALHAEAAQAAQPRATTTTVTARTNKLGTFLVAADGRSLYLFDKDGRDKSNCSGACAKVWPPLMLQGALKGTGGVKANLLGSIARSGGRQVTYDGHPLYYFEGDSKPGQTNGENYDSFGAKWQVLATSGSPIG